MRIKRYVALFNVSFLISTLFLLPIPKVSAKWADEYVMVAYDEEFSGAGGDVLYKYTFVGSIIPLNAELYNEWQWDRALYHFNDVDDGFGTYVEVHMVGTTTFDSEDDANLEETLNEAIFETGWYHKRFEGWWVEYPKGSGKLVRVTMLMVWTLQDNDPLGGGCLPAERAFIVKYQEPWADDNTLLHELSHIWCGDIPPADTPHGNCLMSSEEYFIGFYDEPLQPEYGHITLSLFQWVDYGYTAYEWCDACSTTIEDYMKQMYPEPPPDPWKKELNKDPTYRILFWVAIVICAMIIFYLLNRWEKLKKTKIAKSTNSNFNMLIFLNLCGVLLVSIAKHLEGRPVSEHHSHNVRQTQRYNAFHSYYNPLFHMGK